MRSRPFRRTVQLSGNVSGWQSQVLYPVGVAGRCDGVAIRLGIAPNNNASAIVPYCVTADDSGTLVTLAATPADDNVVFEATSVALTASATDASLNTDFDNPRSFNGLRLGGNITATGAFVINVTVWGILYDLTLPA
jgi:hypothetical protein